MHTVQWYTSLVEFCLVFKRSRLKNKQYIYLICVNSKTLSLDITSDIIVGHTDAELDIILHVNNTAVGVVLSVDLAGEDLVGGDGGDHLGGPAVDGDIIAGAELKRSLYIGNDQEGVLDMGQCCGGVVGQAAHSVPCVTIVKTVTSEII